MRIGVIPEVWHFWKPYKVAWGRSRLLKRRIISGIAGMFSQAGKSEGHPNAGGPSAPAAENKLRDRATVK